MNPARGLAQAAARFLGLALQQPQRTVRGHRLRSAFQQTSGSAGRITDAPFPPPCIRIQRGTFTVLRQIGGHVKANAPGPDDRHRFANLGPQQDIDIGFRLLQPRQVDRARPDTGGNHHRVKTAQVLHRRGGVQSQIDSGQVQRGCKPRQQAVELFLARHPLGQVQLPANFRCLFKQHHPVPPLRRCNRTGQSRSPCPHHRHAFCHLDRLQPQLQLVASARIDQTRRHPPRECMVQTGLIAADAGRYFTSPPRARLGDKLRVRQKRPRHRHHIRLPLRQHRLGHFGRVDPVRRDHRYPHQGPQPRRQPGERRPRHRGRNRRHPRLVPADAGVQHRGPGRLNRMRQLHDLIPAGPIRHQIDQADPVDDQKIPPHRRAHPPHHLDRQPHAVRIRPAPVIGPLVGVPHQELVQEIAFRAHHLDPVITRLLRPQRRRDDRLDFTFNARRIEFARCKRRDRRLDRRGRDAVAPIGIAPGMQDLHRHPPPRRVNPVGNEAMVGDVLRREQPCRPRKHPAMIAGRHAPRHDQPHTPRRPRLIKRRHPVPVARLLQPGMHRPHDHPVGQAKVPKADRR